MSDATAKRYIALDFLRGAAAIAVLLYHIGYMFGDQALHMEKGFLAVDFFFILSGFVIAANYHISVRPNLSWLDFSVARISRLWPLFCLTTAFGFVAVLAKLSKEHGYYDWNAFISSIVLNVILLPSFSAPYQIDRIFIFNGASWSIFFELVVNAAFISQLRYLKVRSLSIITIVAAILLAYVAFMNSGLDGGWSSQNFHVGFVRVFFGFTAGTLIFLIGREIELRQGRQAFILLVVSLWATFFATGGWIVEWLSVTLLFPAIVFFASKCELKNQYARVGGWLGDISYSIYLWQTPLMLLVSGATQKLLSRKIASFAPCSGLLFFLAIVLFSHLSWKFFELPAKSFVRTFIMRMIQRYLPARGTT